MRLDGRVALVFGAGRAGNMGQVIARNIAGSGAITVVCGRDREAIADLAAQIGGSSYVCDITRKSEVEAAISYAAATHGGCHIVVNAAGIGASSPALDTTEEEIDLLMDVQVKGTMFVLQAAGRFMAANGGGSIIQVSSATAAAVVENYAAYIATKSAGEALVKCFANELGAMNVKVNAVAPGFTHTPMTDGAANTPGLADVFASKTPLGRIGTSADIADAIIWLAQDGSFITGQTLQINGGLTLRGNPMGSEIQRAIMKAMQAEA